MTIRREYMLVAMAVSALIGGLVIIVVQKMQGQQQQQQEDTNAHAHNNDNDNNKPVLIFASAGGGWRAMVANMGYANLFAQAGIFSHDSADSSSMLTSMSTESGGAWFATQFFYSEPFYNATTQSTPVELSQFVKNWMDSYRAYTATFPQGPLPHNGDCELLELVNKVVDMHMLKVLVDNCALFVELHGNWADFVEGMLATTSAGYGDANLINRPMVAENRVAALQSTSLGIQMSLVPNTRLRTNNHNNKHDSIVYIGQKNDDDDDDDDDNAMTMYSLPLAVQWIVSDDHDAAYISNTREGTSFPKGLVTFQGDTSKEFDFSHWERDFFLYPLHHHHASALVHFPKKVASDINNCTNGTHNDETEKNSLREPFGGVPPSVAQMAAASSAAVGFVSGLAPSTFAQVLSLTRNSMDATLSTGFSTGLLIQSLTHPALEKTANQFYQSSFFDDTAVCSQWPLRQCDERDGRFIDGYAVDASTAALNIGYYQAKAGSANLKNKTIKLILTPSNLYEKEDEPVYLLSYFNSTFNRKVNPGDFMWPSEQFGVPLRSPQIFGDYLDTKMLESLWEPIEGIDFLKTARIQTTTIKNEAFHVEAGTPVDVLIVQLSSDIPKEILGLDDIDRLKGRLADLAEGIASSSELLSRVRAFV